MSREATDWTWEHCRALREDKILLLEIANEVNHDGLDGYPSQRRMAHLLNCGQASIRRSIERLEGAGELLVLRPTKKGRGQFARYALVMGRDPVKLAEQIGWPPPRLDEETAAEWEQLTLEHTRATARRATDGYEFVNSARGVAPYPLDEGGDNLGERPGDNEKERTGKNRPDPCGGADPQTLTTTFTSRPFPTTLQRPTTEQTAAVLAADDAQAEAATLTPEQVHALVAEAKGQITEVRSEGEMGGTESGAEPGQDAVEDASGEPGRDPDGQAQSSSEGGENPAVEDRWAERADLR